MADYPPPIGDIGFRGFRGNKDFVGMVATLNAVSAHDGVVRHDTVSEMTHSYTHLDNCDLDTDLLVVERGDEVCGYSRATWWVEESTHDRILVHVGWLHPELRGRGIGSAMLEWSEARLAEIAAAKPHSGRQFLMTFVDDAEQAKSALLEDAGYTAAQFYVSMVRSLSDPIPDFRLPEGLELRPTTVDDARAVWEADKEAFRDHTGYSEPTERDFERFLGESTFDPSLWKVAFNADRVVGAVLNRVDPGENERFGFNRAYTEDISVQREWRGRGVAKALITASVAMLRDMGFDEAALAVHTDNPTGALKLYQGLGYSATESSREMRKAFS